MAVIPTATAAVVVHGDNAAGGGEEGGDAGKKQDFVHIQFGWFLP
jgi:hypothetical protein